MSYTLSPICEILKTLCSDDYGKFGAFAAECVRRTEQGYTLPQAWSQSVDECFSFSPFSKQDRELFKCIGEKLGTTDIKGQEAICLMYEELFDGRIKEASQCKEKNASLCSSLGILSGIALGIILI